MDLFEFINVLFKKGKEWDNVSDNMKYRHSFMVFRFLSIKYPREIDSMQLIGLGQEKTARLMDFWHYYLSKNYVRVPKWIRTKSGKKEAKADVLKNIKKEVIKDFQETNNLDSKVFERLLSQNPKEMRSLLLKHSKVVSSNL